MGTPSQGAMFNSTTFARHWHGHNFGDSGLEGKFGLQECPMHVRILLLFG